jgi:hypothetical protein
MKKIMDFTIGFAGLLFFLFVMFNQVSAQSSQEGSKEGKPIPPNVIKTVEKSCVNCHSGHGNFMALSKVNLPKWSEYSPEKQAAKAKAMCNEISKGQMPPKRFRKKHPESVPTSDDIKMICEWAQLLQSPPKAN